MLGRPLTMMRPADSPLRPRLEQTWALPIRPATSTLASPPAATAGRHVMELPPGRINGKGGRLEDDGTFVEGELLQGAPTVSPA